MKKVKIVISTLLLSSLALTLAACGKSNQTKDESANINKMSSVVPKKATKNGSVVKVAIEADTPFMGIFNNELATSTVDTEVMQYGAQTLFSTNNEYVFNDQGPATIKIDHKAKTATVNIKKRGGKWSDGKQVTAKDYEYAYEIISCF